MGGRAILGASKDHIQEWSPNQLRLPGGQSGGGRWTKWLGHQESKVGGLSNGESHDLPGGVTVTKRPQAAKGSTGSVFHVSGGASPSDMHSSPKAAALDAAKRSAQTTAPDSPGGTKRSDLGRVLHAEGSHLPEHQESRNRPGHQTHKRQSLVKEPETMFEGNLPPDEWDGKHDDPDAPPKGEVAKHLLGNYKDTREMYASFYRGTKEWIYGRERKAKHEQIIENFLKGHKRQKNPQAIFTAGGPGSGKSSFLKGASGAPADHVLINPDEVKKQLDEFKEMAAAQDPYAGWGVHEESSQIAAEIYRRARERGYNVVIDGVGDSNPDKFAKKLRDAKAAGYQVRVGVTYLPEKEGQRRVLARAMDPKSPDYGRVVDPGTVSTNYKGVSTRFPEYEGYDWLELTVYSNDVPQGTKPKVIYHSPAGTTNPEPLDKAQMDAFRAQAKKVKAPKPKAKKRKGPVAKAKGLLGGGR